LIDTLINHGTEFNRYADSIDGDFVITPHPDYKNLVIATGDSGHGMK
jgi:sarcosine oxidase/L-pipecolate oxidase